LTRKEKEQVWAAFGEDAVARRWEREGHLPEARFTWEPLDRGVHAANTGGL